MSNPPKLYGIIAGMACITVLIAIHAVTSEAGLPLLSGLVLYLVGNGVAARNNQPSGPALGKSNTVHALVDKPTREIIATDDGEGT